MPIRRATELQVQLDDVYACLGQCGGCILAASERKATRPDMPEEVLDLATTRLVEYASSVAPLDRVNLTFGIADHLLMDESYVAKLHRCGSQVVEAGRPVDRDRSAVFFTTSLVGKPERVVERMKVLRDMTDGAVPLLPLVVLDPRLMMQAKFGPAWREMVLASKDLFGKVDLSINLSRDAVSLMSAEDLVAFAEVNGFDEITVNWTPTLDNARQTLDGAPEILSWLVDFDGLAKTRPHLGTSYRPVIRRTVESVMCSGDGAVPSAAKVVAELVPETVAKSIEIDHHGNLMPKFEAVGDVPHMARFGLPTFGNLRDGSIADLLAAALPRLQSRILAVHSTGACASCPVSGICAGTGFHVATHVARKTGRERDRHSCPHVASTLIRRILDEAVADDAARAA